MDVVIHQGEGIHLPRFPLAQEGDPVQKIDAIAVFPEYRCFFYPPAHHMVKRPGAIESRLSWHTAFL
jgi:hypothetical protein